MKKFIVRIFKYIPKLHQFAGLKCPELSKLDWLVIKFFAALLLLMVGMCHTHLLIQDLQSRFKLRHIEALNKKLKEQETKPDLAEREGK
ncbi:hypothetical protein IM40_02285 [Candidatus Paracaedimonas acanthamoebae]|nr:hypothetical protein IM40_02285 [Candidatus Paracaedimonas acanthamoebae]